MWWWWRKERERGGNGDYDNVAASVIVCVLELIAVMQAAA